MMAVQVFEPMVYVGYFMIILTLKFHAESMAFTLTFDCEYLINQVQVSTALVMDIDVKSK